MDTTLDLLAWIILIVVGEAVAYWIMLDGARNSHEAVRANLFILNGVIMTVALVGWAIWWLTG